MFTENLLSETSVAGKQKSRMSVLSLAQEFTDRSAHLLILGFICQ